MMLFELLRHDDSPALNRGRFLSSRAALLAVAASLMAACGSDDNPGAAQAGAGGGPVITGGMGGTSAGAANIGGAAAGKANVAGANGGSAPGGAGASGSPAGSGGTPSGVAGASQAGSSGASGGISGASGSPAGGASPGGAPSGGTTSAGAATGGSLNGGASSGAGGSGGSAGGTQVPTLVVDNFDTQAPGVPDPSKWEVLTDSGKGTVAVTSDAAHSGTQSVKVVAGSNYSDHAFLINKTAFPLAASELYVRAWVKYDSANWANHITFIKAVGAGGNEVRLGGQAGYYHANLSQGDGLTPNPFVQPCPLCVAPKANEWVCIEGMFAPAANKVQAWVNGMLAVDADAGSDWHSGSGTLPTMLDQIGFGWESYGAIGNTIYFDDVALDDERIGCD